jgi:predicted dehydrogenase
MNNTKLKDKTTQKTVDVAVFGTGSIGTRHLDVLGDLAVGQVLAIPRRPDRASELRSQGFSVADSLEQASGLGAGLCIISTETGHHVEDGLRAMELGFDVLMEKPMASDAAGARSLQEASKKTGRNLFVGCVMRFSDSLNIFRDWLPKAGSVHSVRIECQSYLPDWKPDRDYHKSYSARSVEGGVLLDLIHEVDYAGWIFGWPKEIQGRLKNTGRLGISSEEMAEITWETDAGTSVSIMLDYLSRTPARNMSAFGSDGTLVWDHIAGRVALELPGAVPEAMDSNQERNGMFSSQTTAFLDTVAGKHDDRLATADDGVRAVAICDAVRRSSESGRMEKVEY